MRKNGAHLVGHRLGICFYGDPSRLDCNLFDAETNIDDVLLDPLGHSHPAKRRLIRQVIPYHRMQELLWWHIVLGLRHGFVYVEYNGDDVTCVGEPVQSSVFRWA
jgi:hypothetical protein